MGNKRKRPKALNRKRVQLHMPIKFWKGYSREQFLKNLGFSNRKGESSARNELANFILSILINGFCINWAATILFGYPFLPWTIPGFGFAWWYFKEELPSVLNKIFARRRQE